MAHKKTSFLEFQINLFKAWKLSNLYDTMGGDVEKSKCIFKIMITGEIIEQIIVIFYNDIERNMKNIFFKSILTLQENISR